MLGLGNPGRRFEGTRHNVGFDVVRRVARQQNKTLKKRLFRPYLWSGRGEMVLAMPLTYMNRSGVVVPDLIRATGASLDDLVVVCDNMDLDPGVVRIKRKGSSRAHNGLASIMDAVATGEFTRLYVGIGRPVGKDGVVEYVLSAPPEAEGPLYERALDAAVVALVGLETEPVESVMNRINRRA
ncbi:MAG: aminoacyl-tRNA hydrolase [Spirochaetales bacterium]